MRRGLVAFLAGGIWEILRFVVVFLISAALPSLIPNSHLLLLWLGAPALMLAALFFASAYYPDRVLAYLPILRLGGALAALADIAVTVTGTSDWSGTAAAEAGIPGRLVMIIAFSILVVDLAVVAILVGSQPTDPPRQQDPEVTDLPDYDATEVRTQDGNSEHR